MKDVVPVVLDVRPGSGIGPIQIGMTRPEARAAAIAGGFETRDLRRGGGDGPADLLVADQLFAYFQDGERVVEVEVAASGPCSVSCLKMDLASPYADLLTQMETISRVDETNPEFPWVCAYPDIGLYLWSDTGAQDEDRTPVQAILVRSPEPNALD